MNEEEFDPEHQTEDKMAAETDKHQTEDKMAAETDKATSLYIFHTNSLRLHDNPALLKAIVPGKLFRAVCIMDPFYYGKSISVNIQRFLLESMHDIDSRLRELSSRLYVVQGSFLATLDRLIQEWGVEQVAFEARIDCGGRLLDQATVQLCQEKGVEVVRCHSHTLYSPEDVQGNLDEASLTSMKAFMSIIQKLGSPKEPLPAPNTLEDKVDLAHCYDIPTLAEVCSSEEKLYTGYWTGGETEALLRLDTYIKKRSDPAHKERNTLLDRTAVSPYIRFGCLSVRLMYQCCRQRKVKTFYHGVFNKLLQRDFFLHACATVENFETMVGNPVCLQLPWSNDKDRLMRWLTGTTGYPLVDAAMKQLQQEGFIHYYLREIVACFLTRGDLWVSWVHGLKAFEQNLLDFEAGVCSGNWMQVSCSAFIDGPVAHYHPVKNAQLVDPSGEYVRMYLPQLAHFPEEFIHCPWMAPIAEQEKAGCVIGRDYPIPIVDHTVAGALCSERFKLSIQTFHTDYMSKQSTT